MTGEAFTPEPSEEAVARLVDSVRRAPARRDDLLALLPERLPLYRGLGTNQVVRMRGYILAAFEETGLPEPAFIYALEELENGRDAYLVAAAAKAIRGMEAPSREPVPFLLKAIRNIRYVDDSITFDEYKPRWPVRNYTSGLREIFRTLAWLGARAKSALKDLDALAVSGDLSPACQNELTSAIEGIRSAPGEPAGCCGSGVSLLQTICGIADSTTDASIEMEDQDGLRISYAEFFRGKPCITVFFYTRCNNPNKCSLTVTKLAELQSAIAADDLDGKLKTAAITYDPEYDIPARLKNYGRSRRVRFAEDHRMFRVTSGFDVLQQRLELGVNFTGSTVNHHRIELVIVDASGSVRFIHTRLQWSVAEAIEQARRLLPPAE